MSNRPASGEELFPLKSCSEEIDNCDLKICPPPIPERPAEEFGASESEETGDPISYWAANHTWPINFAESRAIPASNYSNKRQRKWDHPSTCKDEIPRNHTQSRKDGSVPEQHTKSYENYILTQGLDMDEFKAKKLVSPDSIATCEDLQLMRCVAISPSVYSVAQALEAVQLCRDRNEATVSRDVTPLIVPPIKSLYLTGDAGNQFEHLTDEVKTLWHES